MSFGKLAYLIYYQPYNWLKKVGKKGIAGYVTVERHRRAMERHSAELRGTLRKNSPCFEVYLLTGAKYWYQTAFCLYSLQKHLTGVQINAVFIDDGSFTPALIRQASEQFPGSTVRTEQETNDHLVNFLPVSKYPLLNKKRQLYPHIRKLTDVHAGRSGWKMVLDSDMLFFRPPVALESWLKRPLSPFFLRDPCYSYHYTMELMAKLAGSPVEPNLNVGVVGLASETIDWDQLEHWIGSLEVSEGSSYYLEQALCAMIAAGCTLQVAAPDEYIVLPDEKQIRHTVGVLHHYVADSKDGYFKLAWRNLL
jgi:hypothetical protein